MFYVLIKILKQIAYLSVSKLSFTFRASDLPTRRKYVNLVESVKENGGDVK